LTFEIVLDQKRCDQEALRPRHRGIRAPHDRHPWSAQIFLNDPRLPVHPVWIFWTGGTIRSGVSNAWLRQKRDSAPKRHCGSLLPQSPAYLLTAVHSLHNAKQAPEAQPFGMLVWFGWLGSPLGAFAQGSVTWDRCVVRATCCRDVRRSRSKATA
jgi:hypothetical protein